MDVLISHGTEIFFGLVSAGLLAYCKHIYAQKQALEKVKENEQTRLYRQMVLDEIEPLVKEIHTLQEKLNAKISDLEKQYNIDMAEKAKEIELLQKKNDKNIEMIIASYKFRLIQLCKIHLRDGFITQDDFDQVTELYKLYHGLGGNGQAQEYYERVMDLDIVCDDSKSKK